MTEMECVSGTYGVEGFIRQEDMDETQFPEEHTETFLLEKGSEEYYRNHLSDLSDRLKEEHDYWFDVAKLAAALYHLGEVDGFLNDDVLSEDGDGAGLCIEIQYRTDTDYVLRVRVSPGGWYVIAPKKDSGGMFGESAAESEGDNAE